MFKKFLVTSQVFLLVSCSGIKFDPDIHLGSYEYVGLINERGEIISCFDPDFDKFGAMHEDKWKELREILAKAKLPPDVKKSLLQSFDLKVTSKFNYLK